jgi:fused signal recognition particle receptor
MILKFLKSGYQKIKNAFAKTGAMLGKKIRSLFSQEIDEHTLEKLEQLFYEADLGVQTAGELTEKVRSIHRKDPKINAEGIIAEVRKEIAKRLSNYPTSLVDVPDNQLPMVILIVGVNGNGKTTSVAKLSKCFKSQGKKVLIAAADTFRAAAAEQLETWAKRLEIDLIKGAQGSDPAAITFDAITAAKARGVDVLIIDTAGRLHTKTHLMHELEKIKRSCQKVHPSSPHETLLVLDATTGQNAIDQAKIFNSFTPISGLILTKLDGTAKGGIVVSIQQQLGIPVKFIGLGEQIDDFEPFDPEAFVEALFE